jgi:hypothetical protein
LNVLDIFSGAAGGWSKGLQRAGYTTVAACEIDPWRREVFAAEHPGCEPAFPRRRRRSVTVTITTAADFAQWLKAGGMTCIYHSGNLAESSSARPLAMAAYDAAVNREVYLLQRKTLDGGVMQYLAIKPGSGKVPEKFAPDPIIRS